MKSISLFLSFIFASSIVQASPSGAWVAEPAGVQKRLNNVDFTDLNKYATKTRLSALLTEPIIRAAWLGQIVTKSDWIGIQALGAMQGNIDPGGGAGDGSNMFVYTCKGGWVDVGHVIGSALAYKVILQGLRGSPLLRGAVAFLLTQDEFEKFGRVSNQFILHNEWATDGNFTGDITFWAGYFAIRTTFWIEAWQNRAKLRSSVGHFDGNAVSAYTIEDLPSNYYGIQVGERLERKNFVGGTVRAFKREISQLFEEFGAIEFKFKNNVKGCDPSSEKVIREDADYYASEVMKGQVVFSKKAERDPKSPYNFNIHPKKTLHHHCVCDEANNPRK